MTDTNIIILTLIIICLVTQGLIIYLLATLKTVQALVEVNMKNIQNNMLSIERNLAAIESNSERITKNENRLKENGNG